MAEIGLPVIIRPAYILGGRGTGIASYRRRVRGDRRQRSRRQPDQRDPDRGIDRRLEGVRARGDARPRRQLRDHLLDRERRPDGRAHRRLDHRRPAADADRRRVSADARRVDRLHPPRRRRDRRIERAVRRRPGDRSPGRDRDEPARVAQLGAGVEGDRVPDRQDRRQARRRLHARRDPQRHHQGDARPASSRRSTTSSPRSRAGRSRSCRAPPASSARRCSRSARRCRSGARSPNRCRRACVRSSRAGSGSTAIRPRPSSTAAPTTICLTSIERGTPERIFQIGELLRARRRRSRRSTTTARSTRGSSTRCRSSPRSRRCWPTARLDGDDVAATGGAPSGSASPTASWPTSGASPKTTCAPPARRPA